LTRQTGEQFIKDALERNRMQSAEVARAAALESMDKVATAVHFVPEHLQASA